MTTNELDEPWATDPLALRLSRIQDPPVSKELLARVLSGAPALKQRRRIRRIHVLVALAGVGALAGLLAATPAGAKVGRAVLPPGLQQQFGIMTGAPETIPHPGPGDCAIYAGAPDTTTTTFTRNGVTITESTGRCRNGITIKGAQYKAPPPLDLEDAQSLVSFRIRTASWVPPGLQFAGVLMYPTRDYASYEDRAAVSYRSAGASAGFRIDERPGTSVGGIAVPSSAAHPVLVNGHAAIYVHGAYDSEPGGPARWNPNADVVELSWQADGLTYHMTASGLGLSQSDAIRIAESVG